MAKLDHVIIAAAAAIFLVASSPISVREDSRTAVDIVSSGSDFRHRSNFLLQMSTT